jgi:hypothetical protein
MRRFRLPSLATFTTGAVLLTPGKQADLILLRSDDLTVFPASNPVGFIVAAGHPGLVDTVLVAGRVVKRDGVLVDVDLPALGCWNHATGSRPPPASRSMAHGVRARSPVMARSSGGRSGSRPAPSSATSSAEESESSE